MFLPRAAKDLTEIYFIDGYFIKKKKKKKKKEEEEEKEKKCK